MIAIGIVVVTVVVDIVVGVVVDFVVGVVVVPNDFVWEYQSFPLAR